MLSFNAGVRKGGTGCDQTGSHGNKWMLLQKARQEKREALDWKGGADEELK